MIDHPKSISILSIGSGSSGCSSRSTKKQPSKSSGRFSRSENNIQEFDGYGGSPERQKTEKSEGCHLRSEDNIQRKCGTNQMHTALYETSYPTDSCSPPCSGRNGFCPPAGLRPSCKKKSRCRPSCGGNTNKCGGGGCCGGGCRAGCGKPGQLCLPLRSCPNPHCQPRRNSGKSPCSPPRANTRQPPCCKMPQIMGISGDMAGRSGSR